MLSSQRTGQDYTISAQITDDTELDYVKMYYTVVSGDKEPDDFMKVSMDNISGSIFQATVPNPNLVGDETATVYYYICAKDNDDPDGKACDRETCVPDEGKFSFTAYAADSNRCQDDVLEPNGMETPSAVTMGEENTAVYGYQQICPGDEDWFKIEVPATNRLAALLVHEKTHGELELSIVDATGTELVAAEIFEDDLLVMSDTYATDTDAYIRIRGANGSSVENAYGLLVVTESAGDCALDSHEPNNNYLEAMDNNILTDGTYPSLTACGELDQDWYLVEVYAGDRLEVDIDFVHDSGDLDLFIFDSHTVENNESLSEQDALAFGTTSTDDETVIVNYVAESDFYYIVVVPYGDVHTDYNMIVTISFEGCNDSYEPPYNDTAQTADEILATDGTDYRDGVICAGTDIMDWYKIDVFASKMLTLDLLFYHVDGDLDLYLLDETVLSAWEDAIIKASESSDDNETIVYTATTDETLYILVIGYKNASNLYLLDVEVGI